MKQTKLLCILDGFGLRAETDNNCIAHASMPHLKHIITSYPTIALNADGESVGQEDGLVGNSEVGHMNIGGLKKVPQLSYQITKSAEKGYHIDTAIAPDQHISPQELLHSIFSHTKHISDTQNNSKTVHIVSLFSGGRVHSDLRHVASAITCAGESGAHKIILHIITDGRDTAKNKCWEDYQAFKQEYKEIFKKYGDRVVIGSVSGRFFGMDRDNNRDRVLRAMMSMIAPVDLQNDSSPHFQKHFSDIYSYIITQSGISEDEFDTTFTDQRYPLNPSFSQLKYTENLIQKYINTSYARNEFDEHIQPFSLTPFVYPEIQTIHSIKPGDTIWFINYRTDRFKQLMHEFLQINKICDCGWNIIANNDYGVDGYTPYLEIQKEYDWFNPGYYALFKTQPVKNPLAQIISQKGLSQLHIAETEKYNHVTFFLNGGQNKQFEKEQWHVVPSYKIANHADKPEMRAKEVTDYIIEHGIGKKDIVIVNFANPDMVGHTGDFDAGVKALEFLDTQIGRLYNTLKELKGGEMIITADHGNIELVGEHNLGHSHSSTVDTEHNPNSVPCILITQEKQSERLDEISQRLLGCQNNGEISMDHKDVSKVKYLADLYNQAQQEMTLKESKNSIILTNIPKPSFSLYFAGVLLLGLVDEKHQNMR